MSERERKREREIIQVPWTPLHPDDVALVTLEKDCGGEQGAGRKQSRDGMADSPAMIFFGCTQQKHRRHYSETPTIRQKNATIENELFEASEMRSIHETSVPCPLH